MYAFRGIYIPKLLHIWYDVLRRDHCALRKGAFAYEMGHLARAIASTSALVVLWFWEVRRLLRQHRSMVESARCQLAAFEKRAAEAAGNADVAEVLRRSESIYRQAAGNYNETLHRPWIYIPGRLMGFHYEEAAKVPGRVHR